MTATRKDLLEVATLHALGWLLAANAIGVLLALLLVAPGLGSALGPLTYGRWVPVHLDLQLYGWCALPLVALLVRWLLPERAVGRGPSVALALWSTALAIGAAWWLTGHSSGKIFLEWSGASRFLFATALAVLEVALVLGFARSGPRPRLEWWSGWSLLAALATVPVLLFWSASPEVYPPINPDSGGPTGVSLLGSTLGIVALFLLTPFFAGFRPRRLRPVAIIGGLLVAHFAIFGLLEALTHETMSHRDPVQVLALASLLPWWPLVARFLREFDLPRTIRPWLLSFGVWAAVLVSSAVTMFLPGLLDRLKFTNALVGHAHLAMGAMCSSYLILVLQLVLRDTRLHRLFRERTAFLAWHGGLALLIVSLFALGGLEAADPGRLFRPDAASDLLYLLRLAGGVSMLVASARWVGAALAVRADRRVLGSPGSRTAGSKTERSGRRTEEVQWQG